MEEDKTPHPMDEIDANRVAGEFILPLKPKEEEQPATPEQVPAPIKKGRGKVTHVAE